MCQALKFTIILCHKKKHPQLFFGTIVVIQHQLTTCLLRLRPLLTLVSHEVENADLMLIVLMFISSSVDHIIMDQTK